jgi:hypothetical protein
LLDYDSLKLTFGVGIVFYNDVRSLKRCIRSVYGNADYILAVDGKYVYNEWNTEPLSTDGSREYIRDIASEFEGQGLYLIDAPNLTEYAKRQVYVDATQPYGIDVLLILDSDEYVYCCDWLKFRHECYQKMIVRDKMRQNIYNVGFREPMDRPRLWLKAWEIGIGPTHYDFWRKDDPECKEINLGGDTLHTIGSMVISHKHDLRSADSTFAREQWEKKQQALEDSHRLELREQLIASRKQVK